MGNDDGNARCGGWAQILRAMWALHGVQSRKRWFIRGLGAVPDADKSFLVKNCTFGRTSSHASLRLLLSRARVFANPEPANPHQPRFYTHPWTMVTKGNGIPAQGNTNPTFHFWDHVVVLYETGTGDRQLWDPSYGVGPFPNNMIPDPAAVPPNLAVIPNDDPYLTAALDGLGDPTSRHDVPGFNPVLNIAQECVPYSRDYSKFKIDLRGPVADRYDFDRILDDCEIFNPGHRIWVWQSPLNAAVRARRGVINNLQTGDRIRVPWYLIPGFRVRGVDQ